MTERGSASVVVRPARPGEAGMVLDFVRRLAAFEGLDGEIEATEAMFADALFGYEPKIHCDFAEIDGKPVGLALWFYSFASYKGRHGIYLEDLFVLPEAQGHGVGKVLLRHLARRCIDEDLARFEWWVIESNEPSIAFHRSIGAVPMDEWRVYRVTGDALSALADGYHPEPRLVDVEHWD